MRPIAYGQEIDLANPANFLDRLDPGRGLATVVRVTLEQLRKASFLDHRSGFSSAPVKLPLEIVRDWKPARPEQTRLLVHVGFCGSTHLARLLENDGRTTVLREPQALTDLASHWSALARRGEQGHDMPALVDAALGLLNRRWRPKTPVVVKPSNWVNVLLPMLTRSSAIRMVATVSSRREFLRALLRGGPERLGHAGRAALHFASDGVESARLIAQALAENRKPVDTLLLLGGIAHAVQLRLIDAAVERLAGPQVATLRMEEIRTQPHAAVAKAARALDIDAASPEQMSSELIRYSKDPARRFDLDREVHLDAEIDRRHRDSLARTQDWLVRHIGPA